MKFIKENAETLWQVVQVIVAITLLAFAAVKQGGII